MKNITVMVTGVGGGGHGEQIIKALRLSKISYTIVGGDISPFSKGLGEVDYSYLLPPANDPDYIHTVLAVCKKHNVQVLFHESEPELRVMSRKREFFEEEGIFLPINPQSVIDTCMDKKKTMSFLDKHGFYYPQTKSVKSIHDLQSISFLPAVLKPSLGGGGSANVLLAQTHDELLFFGKHLLSIYSEFIAQEYIGTPESEYTVGVLIGMDGFLINSIAVKRFILSSLSNRIKLKNRTNRTELGSLLAISSGISQGEIGPFRKITRPCEKIAAALGCRGAINIQCRYVDKKVFVFEINPRFSGTTSLRAMVGYNEPDILIRLKILHESIPYHFPYKSGVIVRGLHEMLLKEMNLPEAKNLLLDK